MNKLLLYILLLTSFSIVAQAQKSYSFKDNRDGKSYNTVKIGEQVWMSENLEVPKFQNGDIIKRANSSQEWISACNRKEPVWMYSPNNINNGKKLGKIYNYYAVIDKRNLAPLNFRIPFTSDFLFLNNISVSALKSQSGWFISTFTRKVLENVDRIDRNGFPYTDLDFVEREFTIGRYGSNGSGFNAFPSGSINVNGNFDLFGKEFCLWSSTKGDNTNTQQVFKISWDKEIIQIVNASVTQGFYVRCVSGKTQEEIEFERIQKIKKEQFIIDSLKKDKFEKEVKAKQALDLQIAITKRLNDSIKLIKDSLDIIKDDSLKLTLKILDVYKDGIVFEIDGQGHGLILSKLQYVYRDNSSWENTKSNMYKKLSEGGWELPQKGSDVIDFFQKNYKKNEEFRINFKGNRINDYYRFCMSTKYWDIMAFLVGERPKVEDYSKLYFFGIKPF
jgi:uncharacterized protein (TIGR02145 family)